MKPVVYPTKLNFHIPVDVGNMLDELAEHEAKRHGTVNRQIAFREAVKARYREVFGRNPEYDGFLIPEKKSA